MLTAHANTTADDFIAQLRTYVIAMGSSTAVVDCVDNLIGTEDAEEASEDELNEVEAGARKDMKDEILTAVNQWFEDQFNFPEALKISLRAALEKVEV